MRDTLEDTVMRLQAHHQLIAFNSLASLAQPKVGPDIEPAPVVVPPIMQMPTLEQGGGNPFGAIAALGAQRMMDGLLKKKPDVSGISTAQASARMNTPGFLGGGGALTTPGTKFLSGKMKL